MKKKAIILQSGGSTAVINQSLAGVIYEAKRSKTLSHLYGSRFGILGILKPNWINLLECPPRTLTALGETPSSALGSCRHQLNQRECSQAISTLKRRGVETIFIIGGNDSAQTGLKLARQARVKREKLQVIGIPKTIDNDLPGMDHAPGYGSVARFFAQTVQEAALDTRAIRYSDPVKIIETMGRDSGWITASAALGRKKYEDGPHLLYFPERPFHLSKFLQDVKRVYKRFGFAVIVISETIRDHHGKRIGSPASVVAKDQFGHAYVEGTAQYLCHFLESKMGVRARFDKPGTIQRMAMAYISKVDQKEAFGCGVHAVRLMRRSESGVMVAMKRFSNKPYRIQYDMVSLEQVAGHEKALPANFINRAGNDVTDAFKRYALPLTGPMPHNHVSFV